MAKTRGRSSRRRRRGRRSKRTKRSGKSFSKRAAKAVRKIAVEALRGKLEHTFLPAQGYIRDNSSVSSRIGANIWNMGVSGQPTNPPTNAMSEVYHHEADSGNVVEVNLGVDQGLAFRNGQMGGNELLLDRVLVRGWAQMGMEESNLHNPKGATKIDFYFARIKREYWDELNALDQDILWDNFFERIQKFAISSDRDMAEPNSGRPGVV